MTLTLALEDGVELGNGSPATLRLDRRGAIIGRSPMVDWSLPDPDNIVSSRHCEIDYRGEDYVIVDTSTNGTQVNGAALSTPHVLRDGDQIKIGRYRVTARLGASRAAAPASPMQESWGGWDSHGAGAPAGVDPASWDAPKPTAEIDGRGSLSGRWSPAQPIDVASAGGGWGPNPAPAPAMPEAPAASGWGEPAPASPPPVTEDASWGGWSTPAPAARSASDWSSPAEARNAPPAGDDIWGKLAASNVVDWARGGFGSEPAPTPPPVDRSLGLASRNSIAEAPLAAPRVEAPVEPARPSDPTPAPRGLDPAGGGAAASFAAAAGLRREDFRPDDAALLDNAGRLLRRLVAGLVVMLEARARAKAQMGAQSTSLEFEGNNPIKFARTPEQALAQLLNPAERGFMPAERAIEDAFVDLQAHQVATLKAMQGALRATLDRFSPTAIRARAETKGLLGRILPGARDAALWHAYEREFSGVARGSDEAFMDIFAKEFRKAYEDFSRRGHSGEGR